MKMLTHTNSQIDHLSSPPDIIQEIAAKSEGCEYIYRGEPECYPKVSSTLYREYAHIGAASLALEIIQGQMLNEAKKLTYEIDDSEILIEIQHYGGKTNLIDFTTDYLIALFFACDGSPEKDGRVIRQKTETIKDLIKHPRNPRHRIKAQKTVFVIPPNGFIELDKDDIVTVPAAIKQPLLQYLRKHYDISTETIYSDLYSFIKNQDIHRSAYVAFYSGLTFQKIGDDAETPEETQDVYQKAIAYYTEALEQKPDMLEAYLNRGTIYNDLDIDEALENYNTAIQLDPNYTVAYHNRGVTYLRKGDFDRAIKDYNRAIELNPNYAMAYYNRGNAYLHKNDPNPAIRDYTKTIELNANDAEAYTGRGVAYFKKSEVDLAINDYSRAIQLKSDYTIAYYNRGNAYASKGEFNNAIKDYSEVIQLDSNYAEAYYSRGNAYDKKGEMDLAIKDYNKAIELNSDYADAYNNRGIIYGEQGKYDFAMKDFTKAIRLTSGNFNPYYNLGRVYDEKGKYNQAIENYDKVIELNPDYISAYYRRGVAWLHLSEWEKAKSDLTAAAAKGVNVIAQFHQLNGSIRNFEQKIGIQLPPDVAVLLTPPEA
ncbi:hypothetical protein C6499_00745 [Candidatus Poribacteria bacterium]|nr:MAG: hypothetical protein C6499_00745 [Candidatus Poribacteria bacterium]